MIDECCKVSGTDESVLDLKETLKVELKNVKSFHTRWDETMIAMKEHTIEEILFFLDRQLQQSEQLKHRHLSTFTILFHRGGSQDYTRPKKWWSDTWNRKLVPNFQRMVSAKLILKDGARTQSIARICLKIREYDALALEGHSDEDTPGEIRRWEKNWHIVLNKEGKQGPLRNALIFVKRSKRIVNCTKNTRKVAAKELIPSIQHTKQDKIIDNNLKVPRSTTIRFTLEMDGNIIFQQVRLHPRNGSSTMVGS